MAVYTNSRLGAEERSGEPVGSRPIAVNGVKRLRAGLVGCYLDETLERETGIEPATNRLEGCDSTTELLPPEVSFAILTHWVPLL